MYLDLHPDYMKIIPEEEFLGSNLGVKAIFCWLREIQDCRDGSMILYYGDLPRHG
jgi:hypothetical protein